ncbi:MAG: 50S ribosomal protein L3 N(5)-glutamine methyltransferase [Gammaproteobacteria bacterium]
MTPETLETIADFIRWGASRFNAAGLTFAHGTDNALDEAAALVLHALHLPHELPANVWQGRLLAGEKRAVIDLIERRIDERKPAAYLIGRIEFAGLEMEIDERVLIPRSSIAGLIQSGLEPWIDIERIGAVLDLCTGSGCIAIACARAFPRARVDAADISSAALEVAARNVEAHHVGDSVELLRSDLFSALAGRRYDLIICNPPYVSETEYAGLPPEFRHEPALGLLAGPDGLAFIARILGEARSHLEPHGLLILEVGSALEALMRAWPRLEFHWPGHDAQPDDGVLLFTARELDGFRAAGAA